MEAPAALTAMMYGFVGGGVVEVTWDKASIRDFIPFSHTCGSSTDIFLRSGFAPMPVRMMSTSFVASEGWVRTETISETEWAFPSTIRREGEESSVGERRACKRVGERARTVMVREPTGAARQRLRVARAMPPVAEMKRMDLGWVVVVDILDGRELMGEPQTAGGLS